MVPDRQISPQANENFATLETALTHWARKQARTAIGSPFFHAFKARMWILQTQGELLVKPAADECTGQCFDRKDLLALEIVKKITNPAGHGASGSDPDPNAFAKVHMPRVREFLDRKAADVIPVMATFDYTYSDFIFRGTPFDFDIVGDGTLQSEPRSGSAPGRSFADLHLQRPNVPTPASSGPQLIPITTRPDLFYFYYVVIYVSETQGLNSALGQKSNNVACARLADFYRKKAPKVETLGDLMLAYLKEHDPLHHLNTLDEAKTFVSSIQP